MSDESQWPHSWGKRTLDLIGSISLLLLLFPLILLIAVGNYVSLGSPIFFSQMRPGKDNRPFRLVKFRTLSGDTETNEGKIPPNKWAMWLRASGLDELPELWNILKGEMSFVGPRPLLVRYLDRYSPEQARRHHVRPGLTGLAQVKGRNAIDWESRLEWDVHYVKFASLKMDFSILIKTWGILGKTEKAKEPGEFLGSKNVP